MDRSSSDAARLRRRNEALRKELRHYKEELHLLEMHNRTLERLLDEAYDRLEAAGLTDPLEFPISREAIRLFEALPDRFTFDELTDVAEVQELNAEAGAEHLRTWIDEEMIVQTNDGYRKTGRKPYF